ncbi:Glycogen accumulation regulator GarA [Polystyrenella longa]|uniref:Glycogen accumulation regulator GarA n=1 Tax=Polystyrenella longa TaxID=2528007 RepID=A0A518CQ41_9PLAN|nr:FHA domain-containing protein [Polystyrenella longa]QDU81335.1 Glycogen accumulation regulator GarA [Polystyrenella longa]
MSLYLMPVGEGRRIPIKKTVVFIGRHPDCDVVLSKSLKVSRRHCCLALVNNKLMIRDLGSTNGVHVNGRRIKREEVLRLGDELVVGDVAFILKARQSDADAPVEDIETDIHAANATNLDQIEEHLQQRDQSHDQHNNDPEEDPLQVKLNEVDPDKSRLTKAPPSSPADLSAEESQELQERSIYEMNEDEVKSDNQKYHPEDSSIFK